MRDLRLCWHTWHTTVAQLLSRRVLRCVRSLCGRLTMSVSTWLVLGRWTYSTYLHRQRGLVAWHVGTSPGHISGEVQSTCCQCSGSHTGFSSSDRRPRLRAVKGPPPIIPEHAVSGGVYIQGTASDAIHSPLKRAFQHASEQLRRMLYLQRYPASMLQNYPLGSMSRS